MKTQNKKRKGFTLVELLVVIAILAILASVSVVGYVSFTNKAKESNALQEMTQVKTTLLAALADGEETNEGTKFVYDATKGTITLTKGSLADLETAVNSVFPELKDLKGELTADADVATKYTYTLDGFKAQWTIATGEVAIVK